MAATAGIWSHPQAAGQNPGGSVATPLAGPAGGSGGSGSGGNSATISANDFLTLLVTEMQNQDPTANTDPNEYINQLVQVNSLEQLISINQNLTTALGGSGSGRSAGAASGAGVETATSASAPGPGVHIGGLVHQGSGAATAGGLPAAAEAGKLAHGNLSVPESRPAAHRVAQALNGRAHAG